MPSADFINNQEIALIFIGIDNGFTFAQIQASHPHQHIDRFAIANRNHFEEFASFDSFCFFLKSRIRSQFFIHGLGEQDLTKEFIKNVKTINFKE